MDEQRNTDDVYRVKRLKMERDVGMKIQAENQRTERLAELNERIAQMQADTQIKQSESQAKQMESVKHMLQQVIQAKWGPLRNHQIRHHSKPPT